MRRFGSVNLGRIRNPSDLRRLLTDPSFQSEVFVVKPSWYSPHPANFTDSETLRMLLEALDGRVVVTESYSFDR